jgi:general secretion pathway protein I
MLALGVLAAALTVLIRSVASNVHFTAEAESLTVVTNLARGKIFDVEEQLIQDGFLETDQSSQGDFGDEGWPSITWTAKVEKTEIPSFDALQAMQKAQTEAAATLAAGSAGGSGAGSDGTSAFEDSALGGMMSLLGASGSPDAADAAGGALIQGYFSMVQEVLEAAIRKITLTVHYEVLGEKRELAFVLYVTDAAAMRKALQSTGIGALAGGGGSGGGSSGGGSGSGTTPSSGGTTPRPSINNRGGAGGGK